MKIKITSDSTCDLNEELIQKYNIGILPLNVVLDGEKTYRDGVDLNPEDIFSYVSETGKLPKTCATTPEEYAEYFKKSLSEANADALIHFNISSKASSTHLNAVETSKLFNGKVYAVDSYALSSGQGLLILKACEMVQEGKSVQEIVESVQKLRKKVNTSFVPDSLDYLHKGGRCSLVSFMGAKVLKIHPMIEMRDGQLCPTKKYIGNIERCLKNYVTDLAAEYPRYDRTRCFITHSHCEPEVVKKVRAEVEKKFNFDEIIETVAGSVITAHCGKNTLGVLFISE